MSENEDKEQAGLISQDESLDRRDINSAFPSTNPTDDSYFVPNKYYKTTFTEKWKSYAKILKFEPKGNRNKNDLFYIHYRGTNKRMDEWVIPDCFEIFKTRPNPTEWPKIFLTHKDPNMKEEEIKYIDKVVFGKHEIDTWYYSPYPIDKLDINISQVLWVCEYCLKYVTNLKTYIKHYRSCQIHQPPGKEIYKKEDLSVFEVDGLQNKLYCQNLCLLAKFFLESKIRLFYVCHFIFYIFCKIDKDGAHIIGYFSKSKLIKEGHNLSCLLTLPPYQGKGYGKLMIAFSYELSKIEKLIGTPEPPLSDLGKKTYLDYWGWTVLNLLKTLGTNITIKELSERTCISEDDIIETLKELRIISFTRRAPTVLQNNSGVFNEIIEKKVFKPPTIFLDTSCLQWSPSKSKLQ